MRDPAARYRVACESQLLTPNYVSSIYYYLMYLSIGGFVYFDAHGGVCKVYSLLGSALGLGLGLRRTLTLTRAAKGHLVLAEQPQAILQTSCTIYSKYTI